MAKHKKDEVDVQEPHETENEVLGDDETTEVSTENQEIEESVKPIANAMQEAQHRGYFGTPPEEGAK